MSHNYPKWAELPELELYLDQVLLYVNQVCGSAASSRDKGLTPSMVNNYVKHGHVEKPAKKKYSRTQVARLIAITCLKNVFSIQEISSILEKLKEDRDSQTLYDYFVSCMNNEEASDTPSVISSACQTLKLYHHTHQLVQELEDHSQ